MDYISNNAAFLSSFFVPTSVADMHLKLASGDQLKVLLYFLRNVKNGITVSDIAVFLKLNEAEVNDALEFWAQAGVLTKISAHEPATETEAPKPKTVKPANLKPTREEIAAVSATDDRLAFLFQEADMKLGRSLRGNELQTLAWLYLDQGMEVSLILMLVEYAVSENKTTISFIESTALAWLDAGVTTISDAEEQIEARTRKKTAWGIIEAAFGIDHRLPSDRELEFAQKWIIEWNFSREMLREAYNRCIDQKTKLDMRYINGILTKWFKDGVTTLEAEKSSKKAPPKTNFAAYDKNLVDQLLNKDD